MSNEETPRESTSALMDEADAPPNSNAYHAWEIFMVIAALISLTIVAWVALNDVNWPDPQFRTFALIDLGFVAVFLGEFVVLFSKAADKKRFVYENWYELPGLIPL